MKWSTAWPMRVVVAAVATATACGAAEVALRLIDGYALTSARLVSVRPPRVVLQASTAKWLNAQQAESYLSTLPIAPGVDRSWFALDPAPRPASPIDPGLDRRYWGNRGHEAEALYEWNERFLGERLCGGGTGSTSAQASAPPALRDFFVYQPVDASPYPPFRYLRNTHHPSGLITNRFGWRGPDVPLNKPAGRIRIAFAGASTTSDAHGDRFSYPEYIGRWLEAWAAGRQDGVTVDVVNVGREGIGSRSIAAIVETELAAVRPDLVVYYEGSNEFWPNAFVARPILAATQTLARRLPSEHYSAIAVRVGSLVNAGRDGAEPFKPPLPVSWPHDLDEQAPPIHDSRLPVRLPEILANFDRIRAALDRWGGTLMPSSFVWLVYPGLVLEQGRDAVLFHYLNERYWPFSYAHMRRFADFQNRVFAVYASAHGLPFNDVAASFPRDPRLFTDAIHMTAAGIKLKAWLALQSIVPELERRLADGRLPLVDSGGRSVHPAFADGPRLVAAGDLRARCAGADTDRGAAVPSGVRVSR